MHEVIGDPKTERATLALTREEKAAVKGLALARGTTESELLRVMLVDDIVQKWATIAQAARMQAELGEELRAAAAAEAR